MGDFRERRPGKAFAHAQCQLADGRRSGRRGGIVGSETVAHEERHWLLADVAQVFQLRAQVLAVFALERPAGHDGQPRVAHRQAFHAQALFDCLVGPFADDDARHDLNVFLATVGGLQVAALHGLVDLLLNVGDKVGRGQDGPVGAGGQRSGQCLVVAGKDADGAFDLLQQRHEEWDIAGGILDADDVFQVGGHALSGPPLVVAAGALWDVVEYDGQADLVHPLVVLVDFVERRLEVVGRDDQGGCAAGVFGRLGQPHRGPRGGTAGAGDHRFAARFLQGDLEGADSLCLGHVRELAGGAGGHQAVHVRQHVADQLAIGGLVQSVVPGERRHKGGEYTFEPIWFLGHDSSFALFRGPCARHL